MAWLYKRGGKWWIGYRINGTQVLRSTKTSNEAEAKRQLARLNLIDTAHKSGNLTDEFYRALTAKAAASDTLTGYVKQWLAECKGLSIVTIERYSEVIGEFCEHVNATDDTPLLRDIRRESVAAYLRQKRANTSTATAMTCRRILSAFFSYCVDNEALQVSPVPRAKALKLTTDSEKIRRVFTLEELKTMYSKAPSDFWRYMLLAGFYLGQRMGDLICLPWGAVDFERNLVRLTARKTGKPMTIPLRLELRNLLIRDKPGNVKPSTPIWPEQCARYDRHGSKVFSNEFYDDILLPAGLVPKRTHKKSNRKGSGRTVNEVSFHCLRHTFVSLLKITGANQATAKELAGHSTDAISDIYTHVPEDVLTKAINQLPEVTG